MLTNCRKMPLSFLNICCGCRHLMQWWGMSPLRQREWRSWISHNLSKILDQWWLCQYKIHILAIPGHSYDLSHQLCGAPLQLFLSSQESWSGCSSTRRTGTSKETQGNKLLLFYGKLSPFAQVVQMHQQQKKKNNSWASTNKSSILEVFMPLC